MTATAKSAREIIAGELPLIHGGSWLGQLGVSDRIIATLTAHGLEIRPIAPVAAPAVGGKFAGISDQAMREFFERRAPLEFELLTTRLKAEGLREGADEAEQAKRVSATGESDYDRGYYECADKLQKSYLVRADAMEKGEPPPLLHALRKRLTNLSLVPARAGLQIIDVQIHHTRALLEVDEGIAARGRQIGRRVGLVPSREVDRRPFSFYHDIPWAPHRCHRDHQE